ncbi:hypothetical protein F5B22DRAFT_547421 [Xylaria bambusicola]|uniref:uncharacterized protein n=1 Tax=Xylaria bambusicola TaxID=326684 RepID=UPI0020084CA3|nr:uncharacterized protein F5B22DRAFT_547421 [Xylaria bambusicola]KAI0521692.1 hypothetical protein F5B22DRAFT_547421 [Xylaria bambusicola]
MSASRNPESLQAGGEFHSRVPPSEPLTKGGHAPGVLVGNDRVPEFHAETYPAGTAPPEHTYQPRPSESEISAQAYGNAPSAADTLTGATSADVYRGMGKPIQGQERREIEKPHGGHRKKERSGVAGRGGEEGVDFVRVKGADLPEGVYKGMRGKASSEYPAAEERVPAGAEEVAAERKVPERAYDYTQSS